MNRVGYTVVVYDSSGEYVTQFEFMTEETALRAVKLLEESPNRKCKVLRVTTEEVEIKPNGV